VPESKKRAQHCKKRLTLQKKDYIIAKVKAEAPLLTRRQVRQAR
jgi:hypothetical protein